MSLSTQPPTPVNPPLEETIFLNSVSPTVFFKKFFIKG